MRWVETRVARGFISMVASGGGALRGENDVLQFRLEGTCFSTACASPSCLTLTATAGGIVIGTLLAMARLFRATACPVRRLRQLPDRSMPLILVIFWFYIRGHG